MGVNYVYPPFYLLKINHRCICPVQNHQKQMPENQPHLGSPQLMEHWLLSIANDKCRYLSYNPKVDRFDIHNGLDLNRLRHLQRQVNDSMSSSH